MTTVHLHADRGAESDGCRTVCGLPCGTRETTAYRGLDAERVTCTPCAGDLARTMTCGEHRDGVVHYRGAYGCYECHTYRERVLFTHVVPWLT